MDEPRGRPPPGVRGFLALVAELGAWAAALLLLALAGVGLLGWPEALPGWSLWAAAFLVGHRRGRRGRPPPRGHRLGAAVLVGGTAGAMLLGWAEIAGGRAGWSLAPAGLLRAALLEVVVPAWMLGFGARLAMRRAGGGGP